MESREIYIIGRRGSVEERIPEEPLVRVRPRFDLLLRSFREVAGKPALAVIGEDRSPKGREVVAVIGEREEEVREKVGELEAETGRCIYAGAHGIVYKKKYLQALMNCMGFPPAFYRLIAEKYSRRCEYKIQGLRFELELRKPEEEIGELLEWVGNPSRVEVYREGRRVGEIDNGFALSYVEPLEFLEDVHRINRNFELAGEELPIWIVAHE